MSMEVQEYWDKRAAEAKEISTTSTDDVYMRKLEVQAVIEELRLRLPSFPNPKLIDLGCGDGTMLANIVKEFPQITAYGLDFSKEMLQIAQRKHSQVGTNKIQYILADMQDVSEHVDNVNIFISCRSLINVQDTDTQYAIIKNIYDCMSPGDIFIGIENFADTMRRFNKARNVMGIADIKIRWHNHYFEEEIFNSKMSAWFRSLTFNNFASSYYFATRVVYSSMCHTEGKQPDYLHPIHQYAINLPSFGDFCPTKMFIAEK